MLTKKNKNRILDYGLILLTFLSISCNIFAQNSTNTKIQYLSGTDKDHRVNWDFKIDKGRKKSQWSKIAVPSNWELEGFGVYTYGHDWRNLLPESDAIGHYRHYFSVPRDWEHKTIDLVFEGVMTDTHVMINGKEVGPVHQGGFYRFKYEVGKFLKFGEDNLLEVKVKNVSDNESVNKAERDADFWAFAGIYRPVYLEVKPKEFIDRVAIDAQADGIFTMDVYTKNIERGRSIEAQIIDLEGHNIGKIFSTQGKINEDKLTLSSKINNPALWSPEFPNRYVVEVRLKHGSKILHTIKQKFGFRTIQLRAQDGFYVNGEKIKFKGVNRHSFWPSTGRTTSRELSVIDVEIMKDMNMNAVRMSHYPPSQHFLEVTDSLGLFVIDELTGWQNAYDTRVGKKLVRELVIRDVNHPSVVMWANGNEGGNNYDLIDEYPLYDIQGREVIHPWNTLGETNTLHYPSYDYLYNTLTTGDKVYFPTEFLHGLYDGGHGAGLEDYWNIMQKSPLSAGGFLWVFADEGVLRTDMNGFIDVKDKQTWAPDGIVGPYREKEGSFYTIKEIWSPVYIDKENITDEFNGRFKVENRYHFTNLSACNFEWKLINFPAPQDLNSAIKVIKSGKTNSPEVAPNLSGYLQLNLPKNWGESDALYLTATDPHGREIMTWSWPLKTAEKTAKDIISEKVTTKASGGEEAGFLKLLANGIEVNLNTKNGLITSVSNLSGTISFNNGPILTDENSKFKSLKHYQKGRDYVVEMEYEGPISNMVYTMQANGWLKLDYTYYITGRKDFMGINFDYPEDKVKGIKWLGKGPYHVWKNRMKGQTFGVHQKAYNNTITGSEWGYPEFKGYHDRMFWAVLETEESPITIVSATDGMFLRLFTPKDSNNGYTNPPFPEGNISFLDAISPIGTKFRKAGDLGPQGQRTLFHHRQDRSRLWGGTLYFNFGIDDKK